MRNAINQQNADANKDKNVKQAPGAKPGQQQNTDKTGTGNVEKGGVQKPNPQKK